MKLDFGHLAILYNTTKSHMSYDNRIHDFIWSPGLSGVTGLKAELLHFWAFVNLMGRVGLLTEDALSRVRPQNLKT